jgi:PBP1b-binding outer membrane lipoprotein LpoB
MKCQFQPQAAHPKASAMKTTITLALLALLLVGCMSDVDKCAKAGTAMMLTPPTTTTPAEAELQARIHCMQAEAKGQP